MDKAVNQNGAHRVYDVLAGLGHALAERLWPARCLACGDAGEDGRALCAACDVGLPWHDHACRRCALPLPRPVAGAAATPGCAHPADPRPGDADDDGRLCAICQYEPPPLTETRALCHYRAPLNRWVPRFKFHHDLAAGRLLGQLMAEAFAALPRPDALVPVPLHPRRLQRRGYDQALELARPLARALGIPLQARLLQRVRVTSAQSQLDAHARQQNLQDAFEVDAGAALPRHVVLVDDVMTTGATLHAAASALREAGVRRVDAWVCARAL